MQFQTPLVPARLIRRTKRFLADARLEADGREITAHCPNPGSMLGLAQPGTRIWLEPNDDPRKKLKYGWRLVEHESGHFTGVDTGLPNRVLRAALEARALTGLGLAEYEALRPEVRFGQASRVDFLLSGPGRPDLYLEVKSVTLSRQPGLAEFPDAVTARGRRHLRELAAMVALGHRAAMFYLVQRSDCDRFALARDIDPAYGRAFDAAREAGVEILIHATAISPAGVEIAGPLVYRG